jgi:LPS-assembly protein
MHSLLKWLTLVVLALVCAPVTADAAGSMHLRSSTGSDVMISSQKLLGDSTKQTIELTGDVKVIYDQQFISCDHAIIDRKAETVTADGNLVISSTQAYIEGDSAVMSYRDNTGTIMNGFVKSGPVIFEGRVVKKTGPQTYDAESASFTACTTCPTAWTFSGSRIQAEIGGYAYIKHAQLRVANIPTLWLPYLIVPLKSQRQTGLLIPTIDYNSSGGTALGMSFFWTISRSQDATFGLKYYTKRTADSFPKGLLNYRYVLSPKAQGEFSSAIIHDSVFSGTPELNGQNPGSKVNRYFISYEHNYDLPDGFNQKLKLNYVSDLLYPKEFPEEILGRGDPALENRFTLTHNSERTHASLDTSYYINQLHENIIDTNRESVHRFPEIRYDLIERPLASSGLVSDLLFSFHSDYANFTRDDLAWDDGYKDASGMRQIDRSRTYVDPSGEAHPQIFDPSTDVVRTGQRIDLEPQLSSPFRIGSFVDVLPVVSLRHTQYSLNVSPPPGADFEATPYRQYLRGTVSLRTRFSKVYGDNTPPNEKPHASVTNWSDNESRSSNDVLVAPKAPLHPNVYRHEIEPEIVFDGVKDTHETGQNTFLGSVARTPSFLDSQPISDSDFRNSRGVQFDYEDRLTNRNTATAYLSNRLVKKTWLSDGSPVYRQIASLKIGESYDFDEETVPDRQKFLFSDTSALLDMRLDHFETNTLLRYFPYHGKTNTSSRARVMDDHGRYFELNYVENYLITLQRDDSLANHTQTVGFLVGFVEKYINFAGSIDFTPNSWDNFNFAAKSWTALMNIKPPGNCWGIILTLRQDIGQKLDYHVKFDYNFGGQGPTIAAAQ